MAEVWGVLTAAAVGAGVTLYGADKQRSNNNKAIDASNAQSEQASNENWRRYLMTRGVGDNGQAVNTKLPLWASVSRPSGGGVPSLTMTGYVPSASPASPSTRPKPIGFKGGKLIYADAGGGSSGGGDIGSKILNPLGVGGKNKTWYDPLGLF